MTPKAKLELTWIGKENRPKLEPRILLEDPPAPSTARQASQEKSYHVPHRITNDDRFGNRLIFGHTLHFTKMRQHESFPFAACCPKIHWPTR